MMNKVLSIVTVVLLAVSVALSAVILIKNTAVSDKWQSSDAQEGANETEYTYLMDVQYEQEKLETKCNADVTALNEKYAVCWKEKADEYAEKLKDYYSENQNDGMIDEINASLEDWEDYYEKQTAFYSDYLEFVYCGGSITPILSSAYNMNLCRDRAEELYQICLSLSIEVRPL